MILHSLLYPPPCRKMGEEIRMGARQVSLGAYCECWVATALTRARQARSPSPWTGRGILEGRKEGSEKYERTRGASDAPHRRNRPPDGKLEGGMRGSSS